MVQSQYDQSEILTYNLNEGNWTILPQPRLAPSLGTKIIVGLFDSQVDAENFLEPGDTPHSLKLAGTVATHFNPYDPEVVGSLPGNSAAGDKVTPRIVGAVLLKPGEFLLPLARDHVEIKVNDKLDIKDSKHGLDKAKAGEQDTVVALENIAANTGKYVRCLVKGPIHVQSKPKKENS